MMRRRRLPRDKTLAVVKPPAREVNFEVLPSNKRALTKNTERRVRLPDELDVLRDNNEQEYVVLEGKAVALAPMIASCPRGGRAVGTDLGVRYTDPRITVVLGGLVEEEQWIGPGSKRSRPITNLPPGAYVADGAVWCDGTPYAIFKRWVEKQGTLSVVPPESKHFSDKLKAVPTGRRPQITLLIDAIEEA